MANLGNLPPLEWLRAFESAARLSGFPAAAQELGLTQAAVSQRVKSLEAHLGCSLFLRRNRGVGLTVDGESYLPVVKSAFRKLSFGTESLFSTAPTELCIGALGSHCRNVLLPALGRFFRHHPDLRLVVESIAKRSEYDEASAPLLIWFGCGEWAGVQ